MFLNLDLSVDFSQIKQSNTKHTHTHYLRDILLWDTMWRKGSLRGIVLGIRSPPSRASADGRLCGQAELGAGPGWRATVDVRGVIGGLILALWNPWHFGTPGFMLLWALVHTAYLFTRNACQDAPSHAATPKQPILSTKTLHNLATSSSSAVGNSRHLQDNECF